MRSHCLLQLHNHKVLQPHCLGLFVVREGQVEQVEQVGEELRELPALALALVRVHVRLFRHN